MRMIDRLKSSTYVQGYPPASGKSAKLESSLKLLN